MIKKSIYTPNLTDDEFKLLLDEHKKDSEEKITLTKGEYAAYFALKLISESAIRAIECDDCSEKFANEALIRLKDSLRLVNGLENAI